MSNTQSVQKLFREMLSLSVGLMLALASAPTLASRIVIPGDAANDVLGTSVVVLPNGNIVVSDPGYDGAESDIGAVFMYSKNGVRISAMYGTAHSDLIGNGGIVLLDDGNFVVRSLV